MGMETNDWDPAVQWHIIVVEKITLKISNLIHFLNLISNKI